AFAEAWPESGICAAAGAQMEGELVLQATGPFQPTPIVQQLVHKLPWRHHCVLLDKLKTRNDREWYLRKAVEHGWSRNILVMQIESRLMERSGGAITNFNLTLPKPQSDL